MLVKISNIKFHENMFSSFCIVGFRLMLISAFLQLLVENAPKVYWTGDNFREGLIK
jgi:hypothetical protein